MHYVDGMTFEEIGEQVEMTASGVRRRMQRLRAGVMKSYGKGRADVVIGKEIS